jgi:hypothetical protein
MYGRVTPPPPPRMQMAREWSSPTGTRWRCMVATMTKRWRAPLRFSRCVGTGQSPSFSSDCWAVGLTSCCVRSGPVVVTGLPGGKSGSPRLGRR